MLTESLSPLAQAVFVMTTLQRYNAPKISLAASFSFLKTDRLVQALFTPPVVLKPCISFPCILPMQADKKRGTRTSLRSYNGTPSAQPPHRPSWEGKRGGLGMGKGTLSPGSLSHPKNMIFSQFRATAAGSVPSCWRIYSFMSSAMASSRLSVPGYAPLSSTVRKAFSSSGRVLLGEMGAKAGKAARALRVVHRFELGIFGGDGSEEGAGRFHHLTRRR